MKNPLRKNGDYLAGLEGKVLERTGDAPGEKAPGAFCRFKFEGSTGFVNLPRIARVPRNGANNPRI